MGLACLCGPLVEVWDLSLTWAIPPSKTFALAGGQMPLDGGEDRPITALNVLGYGINIILFLRGPGSIKGAVQQVLQLSGLGLLIQMLGIPLDADF